MQSSTWVRIKPGDRVGVAGALFYPAWSTTVFNGSVVDTMGSNGQSAAQPDGYDERRTLFAPKRDLRAGDFETVQVSLFAGPDGFAGADIFIQPKDAAPDQVQYVKFLRVEPKQNPPGLPASAATTATVCFLVV